MDTLTDLLREFIRTFNRASFNLIPIAVGFLYWTTAFQVIFDLLKNITDLPFFRLLKLMLVYFEYRYVIENWADIMKMLRDTVIRIGEKGAGVSYNPFKIDPNNLFDKIYALMLPLADKFEILSGRTYGYGIALFLGILLAMFLSLNLFIFYLELLAITSISVIFIPFLVFEKTDFLEKKFSQQLYHN